MKPEYRSVIPHRLVFRGGDAPLEGAPGRLNLGGESSSARRISRKTPRNAPHLRAFPLGNLWEFIEKPREFIDIYRIFRNCSGVIGLDFAARLPPR